MNSRKWQKKMPECHDNQERHILFLSSMSLFYCPLSQIFITRTHLWLTFWCAHTLKLTCVVINEFILCNLFFSFLKGTHPSPHAEWMSYFDFYLLLLLPSFIFLCSSASNMINTWPIFPSRVDLYKATMVAVMACNFWSLPLNRGSRMDQMSMSRM